MVYGRHSMEFSLSLLQLNVTALWHQALVLVNQRLSPTRKVLWASNQIRKIAGYACTGTAKETAC